MKTPHIANAPVPQPLTVGLRWAFRIEEAAQLALAAVAFSSPSLLDFGQGWFWGLFLLPDVGMLGYLGGPRLGAWTYNTLHHKGLFALLILVGFLFATPLLMGAGVIGFGHAAFDRMLGYGLKLPQGFQYTHLGKIGKPDAPAQV